MEFFNSYEDKIRAEAYSKLEFHKTYYLANRDLPNIIEEHVKGKKALDFGCGTGRSTRFLRKIGFMTVGIDISNEMIQIAKKLDSDGDYLLIKDGDFSKLSANSFDLVLSSFTFDNIPTMEKKVILFSGLPLISMQVLILESLMPPAILTVVYASGFNLDVETASTIVTIGTLLFLPLVPILLLVLG